MTFKKFISRKFPDFVKKAKEHIDKSYLESKSLQKLVDNNNVKPINLEKLKKYNSYSQELLLYLTYYKVLHTAIYDKKLIFDKNLIYDSINYFEKFEEYENCDYIKKYFKL